MTHHLPGLPFLAALALTAIAPTVPLLAKVTLTASTPAAGAKAKSIPDDT